MSLRYSFHREARREVSHALNFYRTSASSEIAFEFLQIFDSAIDLLRNHPEAAPLYHNNVRRKVLRKFPYPIMYVIRNDQLRILAVAHQSRRPLYWLGRE